MTLHDFHSLMPITPRSDRVMVRGAGSYLWDDSGRRYLDFIQGWAVNALGHSPPEIQQALVEQSGLLLTPSPAFHNAPQLALSHRLTESSGLARVFFCNSGAEANEGAIKMARKWGKENRGGAYEVITTEGAFHGRTLAMMAASGKPGWDEMFPPKMPGFLRVPFGDARAVEASIKDHTAAILVEPIQGEAGVILPPSGYLAELREIADRRNVLLMLDEVQTGIGRTGALFAFEHEGVLPDVLSLGKGLGGGVPLAAVVTSRRAGCFAHGEQGGTYNGNPLMTAVGVRVLQTVAERKFLEGVRDAGSYLTERLTSIAGRFPLRNVRGKGLLLAFDLDNPRAEALREACFMRGLLINAPRPHTVRLMPSLRVTASEIDEMATVLEAALRTV